MHQEKQIDAVVAKGGGGSGGGVSAGVVAMRGMQSVPRVSTFRRMGARPGFER